MLVNFSSGQSGVALFSGAVSPATEAGENGSQKGGSSRTTYTSVNENFRPGSEVYRRTLVDFPAQYAKFKVSIFRIVVHKAFLKKFFSSPRFSHLVGMVTRLCGRRRRISIDRRGSVVFFSRLLAY